MPILKERERERERKERENRLVTLHIGIVG